MCVAVEHLHVTDDASNNNTSLILKHRINPKLFIENKVCATFVRMNPETVKRLQSCTSRQGWL